MILIISIAVIGIISFVLAVRSVKKELSVPEEVKGVRARQRIAHPFSGAILFLREKIVHYSAGDPASDSEEKDS